MQVDSGGPSLDLPEECGGVQTCSRSYLHTHKALKPDSGPDTPPGVSVLTPLPQRK